MIAPLGLALSILAIGISATTLWLTLLRRGTVKMTRPTVFYFGPDGSPQKGPKVYFRALLYCSAKRGRVVESMFVRVRRGETLQTFNVWVHGTDKLERGSGMYIGSEGKALNHHFLLPVETNFSFSPGAYNVEIFALLCGRTTPVRLQAMELRVTEKQASQMKEKGAGLYFDWGPDSQRYMAHVREQPRVPDPERLLEILTGKP